MSDGGLHFTSFGNLDRGLLGQIEPDIIVSPLVGPGFDALEIARRLQECGFTGCYRAIADKLPHADLVRREVRAAAPDVEFDLVDAADLSERG
ncbi:hypothetical protein OG2516_03368 [Oceanicola granulosus HTCC2516]|uniref:Uncharacterized protein n=2 Tax=Oceanicola granulosus TaxID=252302 RepID=Q2CE52_OCEGH|nr:hypothetical protein OG2516_03368 [Oceanicola granulosus HTCC2516]